MKNFLKKGSLLAVLLTFFMGAYAQAPFVTTWNVTATQSGTYEITIPTHPGNQYSYSYEVHWGDGNIDYNVTGNITHDYANTGGAGQYQVEIYGEFPAIFFNNQGDKDKIISIDQWGDHSWQTFQFAFAGCSNLGYNAHDVPNLGEVIDLSYMFYKATSFSGDLNDWDVTPVKYMRGTFSETEEFNGPIDKWNMSNVYDITSMFEGALAFNDDISNWSFEVLEEMTYAFARTSVFNQPIGSWNTANVIDMSGVFANALEFNQHLEWETEQVETMHNMFSGAVNYNQPITFSVSSVRDMSHMFQATPSFDQNLGDLDISNVTDMRYMLSASNLSVCNYEQTLDGWSGSAGGGVTLGADGLFYYDDSGWSSLVSGNGWTILGDNQHKVDVCGLTSNTCHVGSSTFFKTSWTVNAGNTSITIPTSVNYNNYNYDIDWESDGIFDVFNQTGSVSHTYPSAGTYQVSIRGDFPTISFGITGNNPNTANAAKISSIDQWGCIEWSTFNYSFEDCVNLTYNAVDAPDLSGVNNLGGMFKGASAFNGNLNNWDVYTIIQMGSMFSQASSFNGNISNWDVSNVISMNNMFGDASSFNSNISNWDVSNVTNMAHMFRGTPFNVDIGNWNVSNVTIISYMFQGAINFNQDISSWDVSNVTNMDLLFNGAYSFNNGDPGNNASNPLNNWDVSSVTTMHSTFSAATSFNQDIGSWDVSNVTNMHSTLSGCFSFNQNINSWDVSNVTTMSGTFSSAIDFNQPLDNWNVSNVTTMQSMFIGAYSFDQDISNWDVSNVTNMSAMFNEADAFNQDIGSWDVSNVTNMAFMFSGAGDFSHDISNWDVSSVKNMSSMFRQAHNFDHDISSWDVSGVTNMNRMFYLSGSFNQNLGTWDLSSATNVTEMFDYSGMRLLAYDGTITGWSNNGNLGLGLTLGAQNVYYCDIATNGALANMTSNGWTFNGHIYDCSAPLRTKPGNSNPVNQLPTGNFTVNNSRNTLTITPPVSSTVLANNNPTNVQLFNMNGKLIYQRTQHGNITIPIGSFSSGVYILTIDDGNTAETRKVAIR